MIATVSIVLCLSGDCQKVEWIAHDVPQAYCSTALWQIDAWRWSEAAALLEQGYTMISVDCVVA